MRKFVLPLLLILEVAVFTKLGGTEFDSVAAFLNYFQWYLSDLIVQATPVLVLALGMTVVLMTAGIDLSVGSMVALTACVMSTFEGGPSFWTTAVPLGLLVAVSLGLFNGLLIARLDVPPIIATLGTMIFYRGLCFITMGDRENAPFLEVPGYEWFGQFTGAALMALVVLLAGGSYFTWSRWRREVLMIGGNPIAARYAGVPTDRRLCEVYGLMGVCAFLAALCYTARNGSISASSLTGLELQVIVAVVLGGTRVEGGVGSLVGSVFGVLLIAALREGLRGASIWGQEWLPFKISYLEFVLLGVLLIAGVWLNTHAAKADARETK